MNKARRTAIKKVFEQLEELMATVEVIRDEEQDAFDNLPESFQSSERGEIMEENIDALDSAYNSIEEAKDLLEELL